MWRTPPPLQQGKHYPKQQRQMEPVGRKNAPGASRKKGPQSGPRESQGVCPDPRLREQEAAEQEEELYPQQPFLRQGLAPARRRTPETTGEQGIGVKGEDPKDRKPPDPVQGRYSMEWSRAAA